MVVPFVAAVMALGLAGCIESQRPRFVVDSADGASEDVEEIEEISVDTQVAEADVVPVDCVVDGDCEQPPEPCHERVCDEGQCVAQAKGDSAACDDGDPCTRDGTCSGEECLKGGPVVDGTGCDDDELVCNGASTCQDGFCVIALPPTCSDSGAQCADGAVCSEEMGGLCVDLPAEDGLACDGPSLGDALAEWTCSVGQCVPPDMVFVRGGVFTMGCPTGYCSVNNDNAPEHEVRLSPFAIDRTEVSEDEFRRCRDDAEGRGFQCAPRPNEDEPEVDAQDGDAPLRWVDWERAETVCAYQDKRLCTEAEWEYAARGVGTAFYPWGNLPPTCERATFFDEGAVGCGTGEPTSVGAKPLGASTFGALEMAGNVSEWCADYYRPDVYGPRAGSTPLDPVQSQMDVSDSHVVRGGSFRDGTGALRVFVRSAEPTGVADDDLGVRCCLTSPWALPTTKD